MSAALGLSGLIDYSDHERAKWREWIAADPQRLRLRFQEGGRFPTLWELFEHIFLVERRHLSRLEGGTPPDATGVRGGDWIALFEYADLVRADFRQYVADLRDDDANQPLTVHAQSGTRTITRRRLAAHVLIHEIRHLAQIAYAARNGGHAPPGEHDLFFCPER